MLQAKHYNTHSPSGGQILETGFVRMEQQTNSYVIFGLIGSCSSTIVCSRINCTPFAETQSAVDVCGISWDDPKYEGISGIFSLWWSVGPCYPRRVTSVIRSTHFSNWRWLLTIWAVCDLCDKSLIFRFAEAASRPVDHSKSCNPTRHRLAVALIPLCMHDMNNGPTTNLHKGGLWIHKNCWDIGRTSRRQMIG